jgi:hypothetical protein
MTPTTVSIVAGPCRPMSNQFWQHITSSNASQVPLTSNILHTPTVITSLRLSKPPILHWRQGPSRAATMKGIPHTPTISLQITSGYRIARSTKDRITRRQSVARLSHTKGVKEMCLPGQACA